MATAPKTTLTPSPTWNLAPDDAAYDALTELFLGDTAARVARGGARVLPALTESEDDRTPPSITRHAVVETLVMGHLPFRSGPWASQYARAVAKSEGCRVGLVRVLSGETSVDLFAPTTMTAPAERVPTLSEAIAWASERVGRWIVQADDVDEPLLAGELSVDKVTLLSGVNEAAIVAAYHTIKRLMHGKQAGPHRPSIRVSMIGATDDRALAVGSKIQRAAQVFLGAEIEIGPSVGKVGPTGGVLIHRGPTELNAIGVTALLSGLAPAANEAVAEPVVPDEARAPDVPVQPEAVVVPGPVDAPAEVEPAAVSLPEPTVSVTKVRVNLAEHVGGLTALAARCPDDELVELAVDASGRLHLLRDGGDEHALSNLMMVNAWAKRHARLLQMAAPSLTNAEDAPVLHLFTPNARLGRTIGESGVQLHLLASVHVGNQMAWYCTELN